MTRSTLGGRGVLFASCVSACASMCFCGLCVLCFLILLCVCVCMCLRAISLAILHSFASPTSSTTTDNNDDQIPLACFTFQAVQ